MTFHEYIGKMWEYFSEAAIITSITLIRHIQKQHKIELELLEDSLTEEFALPSIFPEALINGMILHLTRLESISVSRFNDLCNIIEGLI